MAVKCNTFLVGKILTTKWYKPRYLPFNHQFSFTSGFVMTEKKKSFR